MKRTICICDRCGKEVTWLYDIPTISVKGLVFEVDTQHKHCELCETCAKYLCMTIKKTCKKKVSEDGDD